MTTNNNTTTQGDSNVTTDMEKAMSQQHTQQLTLQDDRIIKEDTGYIDDIPSSVPNIVSDMNAAKMSSEDLMRMPLITRVVDWTTTQERNEVVASFDLPSVFDEIELYHKRILQLYNFTNFTLRMDFRINTTPFHSGRLLVLFDPMDLTRVQPELLGRTNRELNVFRGSMQPSVELDAGTNNVASLDIPWEHFLSYINMNNDISSQYQNGTIYVLVQNKLFVPTNAPNSVTLNVLVSCKDVNLEIPVRPHNLQFVRPQQVNANSGLAKTATGAIADLATGNLGGVLDKGASALSKFLNLDKPAKMDTKVTNCLSSASPLSHVVGIDGSVRLSTDPESSYTENHFSLAPVSEKNISQILQTRCLFDIKPWSITDDVNTDIAVYKVRPGLTGANLQIITGTSPILYKETPTYLSYLEKAFRFWSGGIVFKFKFASSQNHSGKLQFSFEPTITPSPLSPDDTVISHGQGPSIIFDLKESKTLEFHVPYVADRPQLYTSNLNDPTVDDYGNDHCLGYLRVKVLNKLTTTGNIAPSIDMNCYIAGAPDFELDVLSIASGQALSVYDLPNPTAVNANMETDTTKTRAEDRSEGFSIVKGEMSRTRRNRFKDQIIDVRDACKRYTLLCEDAIVLDPYNFWQSGTGASSGIFAGMRGYQVGMRMGALGRTSASYNTLFYFSNLYVFKSGSFRYKFIPFVDRTIPIVWQTRYGVATVSNASVAPETTNPVNDSYPQTIQNSSQDVSIEVETPYYSIFNQHLVSYDPNLPSNPSIYTPYSSGVLSLIAKTCDISKLPTGPDDTRKAIPYEVYIAAGNDYDLRFLISPPDIYRGQVID